MRDSTVFRDLALYLEREATRLRGLGYAKWAGHLLEDADRLLKHGEHLAQAESPLPSAASLAGIDPGFRPADQREAMLEDLLRYMLRCSDAGMWPTSRIAEVRAALGDQGEQS